MKAHIYPPVFLPVLVAIVFYSAIAALGTGCGTDSVRPPVNHNEDSIAIKEVQLIVPDSALSDAKIRSWHKASEHTKTANAMAFVRKALRADSTRGPVDINALARELKSCIDASSSGMLTMQDDLVRDLALSCLLSMKLDEDIKIKKAP